MQIGKMAWRNVWRNQRRSLVTVSAMTLALLVMILYSALMEGYLRDMERNVVDLEVGDVQVFAPDYRRHPSLYTRIEPVSSVLGALREAGFQASARLLAFGMMAAGDASAGVSFRGIDPEQDARVSYVDRQVMSGTWLDPKKPHGVVLGRRLARTLAVKAGDEVIALSQAADGSMAYDKYDVRGVLNSIGDATDRSGVFMTEAAFRELFVVPEGAHQLIVRRPEGLDLDAAAKQMRLIAPALDVKTWRELLPTLSSLLDSARAIMVVMSLVIYLAVAILILNAMLMAVFERVREIGVLKAIGVEPREVLGMLFAESGIQAGLAIAAGLLLAVPGLWYLATVGIDFSRLAGISILGVALDPIWHAAISARSVASPVLLLVGIVALAVLYPAFKAAWIRPVDAMRYR